MSLVGYLKGIVADYILIKPDLKNVFDHHFFALKYYINKTASTENFASLLNISPQDVDHIANTYYGVNFTKLINEHKCQHLIEELVNPINSNLPMESIVKICGYENIESFYSSVKSKQSTNY